MQVKQTLKAQHDCGDLASFKFIHLTDKQWRFKVSIHYSQCNEKYIRFTTFIELQVVF